MRILVTGAAGFLGSHLLDRIMGRPEVSQVIALDSLWTGTWANVSHITDDRLVRATGKAEEFASDVKFDEVVHLASPASPKWYMADPLATIQANISGAIRLLDVLDHRGKFCFCSTSEVYGDPRVTPQPETYKGFVDCTGPRSSYDESKRCTEALLFEMKRTRGLNIRVARLFNVYGPRTRVNDGRAISNFVTSALLGRPIQVYGDGRQTRSWGYIDDIASGLSQFFFDPSIDYSGPLNIGNDREVSILETARYVQQLVPGATIEFSAPAPDDPSNRRPDLTLARTVLRNWHCTTAYEDGIRQTLDWFRATLAPDRAKRGARDA